MERTASSELIAEGEIANLNARLRGLSAALEKSEAELQEANDLLSIAYMDGGLDMQDALRKANQRNKELEAHVARLREALKALAGLADGEMSFNIAQEALAEIPEQSLAAIEDRVREEDAKVCDEQGARDKAYADNCFKGGFNESCALSSAMGAKACAEAIRGMKI